MRKLGSGDRLHGGIQIHQPSGCYTVHYGPCLGKGNDSSETRLRAPIAARQSVHSMPLIAGSTELNELCRTSYQRRKTGIVVKTEWCTKLKIVSSANKREAMEENIE